MTANNIILDDKQLLCQLTGLTKKVSDKENNVQSIIRMLNEEYGFDLDVMERDFNIIYEDMDTGKNIPNSKIIMTANHEANILYFTAFKISYPFRY